MCCMKTNLIDILHKVDSKVKPVCQLRRWAVSHPYAAQPTTSGVKALDATLRHHTGHCTVLSDCARA